MKSEKRRINRTEPFCDMSNIQLPIGMELDLSQIFISFSEPECRDDELCGGKGASLGILHFLAQRKAQSRHPTFYVPNGFVLTTNAHKLQIARCPELSNAIDAITDVALNRTDGDLADVCKYANGLFKETVVEPEVVQAILSIFDVLQENYINQGNISERPAFRVAVRSSAVCEDGADASSAGQNDTFLGCSTSDEVIQAVKNCWASLYSHHSTSYRHQNMQPIATPMAVVIQTMVPADCAGVLFTRHPVDNDPHKMLVSANYGLGETVVSGSVDPDMYTIQRSYRGNHLYLARKYIGQKSHSIYMHSNGEMLRSTIQFQFCANNRYHLQAMWKKWRRNQMNEVNSAWAMIKSLNWPMWDYFWSDSMAMPEILNGPYSIIAFICCSHDQWLRWRRSRRGNCCMNSIRP